MDSITNVLSKTIDSLRQFVIINTDLAEDQVFSVPFYGSNDKPFCSVVIPDWQRKDENIIEMSVIVDYQAYISSYDNSGNDLGDVMDAAQDLQNLFDSRNNTRNFSNIIRGKCTPKGKIQIFFTQKNKPFCQLEFKLEVQSRQESLNEPLTAQI
jgi:hypothetical protein